MCASFDIFSRYLKKCRTPVFLVCDLFAKNIEAIGGC